MDKKELTNDMLDIEYSSSNINDLHKRYQSIPIGELATLGVSFSQIPAFINSVKQVTKAKNGNAINGGNGFYYVSNIKDKLTLYKDGRGYLGEDMSHGSINHAVLTPADDIVASSSMANASQYLTNTALLMAVYTLDKKLDEIKETQKDIKDILLEEKEAEMIGDMDTLDDIATQYKFNIENETFITTKLNQVQNIERSSKTKITFYNKQIKDKLEKLHRVQFDIKNTIKEVYDIFVNYNTSLYIYSYAVYLEVRLLKNFDSDYLKEMADEIRKYSNQYHFFYTQCYDILEKYAQETVNTQIKNIFNKALDTAKKANEIVDSAIKNVDVNVLKNVETKEKKEIVQNQMLEFTKVKDCETHVFTSNLDFLADVDQDSFEMYFDDEKVYLCY